MIYLLIRDRISRSQFLLRTDGALGTLLFGGALKASTTSASAGFSQNITGVYVPEGTRYLITSDKPEEISWGFLPNRDAEPILTVESGDVVTMEQISHEGILDDQGDPVEFFESHGVAEEEILDDQLMVYEEVEHEGEGPHVVTGPVAVEGAEPGDWLDVRCLGIEPRVDCGVKTPEMSYCPFHEGDICTLCSTLERERHDMCKKQGSNGEAQPVYMLGGEIKRKQ